MTNPLNFRTEFYSECINKQNNFLKSTFLEFREPQNGLFLWNLKSQNGNEGNRKWKLLINQ